MEFKKYPSLNNHYRQKEISYWLDNYPELKDEEYEITEKLHGSNMQIVITKESIKYGKRTSFLEEGESFYGYQEVMEKYQGDFTKLQNFIKDNHFGSIRIYGELFGGKIQKGVDYGIKKQFKLFNIYVNDFLQTPLFVRSILYESDVSMDLHVPVIKIVKGIFNVLEFDTKFNSKILNKEGNICEGIVAKPLNGIYESSQGSVFYIKKKNEEFKEKSKESSSKSVTPLSSEILKLQCEFELYINENRLNSVFSKEGEIQSDKEIGKFIKLLMEDAKEDFIKDFGDVLSNLDKKDLKMVYGKGNKNCANLVKKYL